MAAWYGMVWYGMVWYGMVWYGKWVHSTSDAPISASVQHITSRYLSLKCNALTLFHCPTGRALIASIGMTGMHKQNDLVHMCPHKND